MTPAATAFAQGLQAALADLGLTVTVHQTDVGTDLLAVEDAGHPWPSPLAAIWWHGVKWQALPHGKRRCLQEGWCCSAPALEGTIGEHPVPTVAAAAAYLRDAIAWRATP